MEYCKTIFFTAIYFHDFDLMSMFMATYFHCDLLLRTAVLDYGRTMYSISSLTFSQFFSNSFLSRKN